MPAFKDLNGKTHEIRIDLRTIRQVRDQTDVLLGGLLHDDGKPLGLLHDDPVHLAEVLSAAIGEDLLDVLGGPSMSDGLDALIEAVAIWTEGDRQNAEQTAKADRLRNTHAMIKRLLEQSAKLYAEATAELSDEQILKAVSTDAD